MYGGFRGRSAEDAAHLLASEMEACRVAGTHCSLMSIDIFKCFDQVAREVVAVVGDRVGLPTDLATGWFHFMKQLTMRNCLASGGGAALLPQP